MNTMYKIHKSLRTTLELTIQFKQKRRYFHLLWYITYCVAVPFTFRKILYPWKTKTLLIDTEYCVNRVVKAKIGIQIFVK